MATEYGGYMGKILLIDLTTETTEEYPFTDQQRRETLGGKALAYLNYKFHKKTKLPKHLRNVDPEAYYKARGWDENGVPSKFVYTPDSQ